jgi:hypothetical protein
MEMNLKTLLRGLDDSLDAERQKKTMNLFRAALNREQVGRLPLVVTYPYPHSRPAKPFPHREIFDNPEKMLFNELVHAFNTSIYLHDEINDDLPYTVRANFGTVIIASLFGAAVEQRDDNPPWVRHFKTLDEFTSIFDCDPFDFSQGICRQVTERYQFYRDIIAGYPNLQQCLKIVLPDLQGPLDSLELLRGSALYEDFIMEPEMVENGLQLMARAQSGFAKHLRQFVTDGPEGYSHQHAAMIPGNILIRNDSAIMISPEMYAGQVALHDEYVLHESGGGGVHSCGKIDFNIPEIFRLPSLTCFDFGQSYMNNIEEVYGLALAAEISLIRLRLSREELLAGNLMERFPTGVTLVYDAVSFDDAKNMIKLYKNIYGCQ